MTVSLRVSKPSRQKTGTLGITTGSDGTLTRVPGGGSSEQVGPPPRKRLSWAGTPSGTGASCWRRPSREADWVGEVAAAVGVVGGVTGLVDLVGGVGFVDEGDDVRVAGLPVEKVGRATGVTVGDGVGVPGEAGRGVRACVAGGCWPGCSLCSPVGWIMRAVAAVRTTITGMAARRTRRAEIMAPLRPGSAGR
jgi:hypothetical protein